GPARELPHRSVLVLAYRDRSGPGRGLVQPGGVPAGPRLLRARVGTVSQNPPLQIPGSGPVDDLFSRMAFVQGTRVGSYKQLIRNGLHACSAEPRWLGL